MTRSLHGLLAEALLAGPACDPRPASDPAALAELAESLRLRGRQLLGRSLSIREIDAGSCNGCELEINALANPVYDLERFGLKFVASPKHADVLLVTGPVTRNMQAALLRAYEATPEPKWLVAAGDCAAGCGVFAASPACLGALAAILPVDLHIKGCPPSPTALLSGLLALLDTVSGLSTTETG